ncbi:MAG TPA: Rieske 2Fe-2S domain-containing protein [Opitutaceae bacterium]|nr:Rieske 2Fe-2S domain-containing protein [Lacunisphaera sp.]HWA09373.1 Rieske 2Fe-2S domain-containing protein [Opitutaceae bacterium]
MEKRSHSPQPTPRRDFIAKAGAIILGAGALVVPVVSGLLAVFNPLRRRAQAGDAVRVASLKALPAGGEPRKFPVLATRVDAWNRTPDVPVGAVYLRRVGEGEVKAFNVACPHAGCFVDFRADRNHYLCPCHNSTFTLDGKVLDPKSPSPRSLDELPVEIRNGDEIWVKFQNFRAGVKERILA